MFILLIIRTDCLLKLCSFLLLTMLKTVAINLKCAGCDALLRKVTDKKKHVKNVNVANDFFDV